MQIKTTMRYQLTPVIKEKGNNVLMREWIKENLCALLVEMKTDAAIMENSMEHPHTCTAHGDRKQCGAGQGGGVGTELRWAWHGVGGTFVMVSTIKKNFNS